MRRKRLNTSNSSTLYLPVINSPRARARARVPWPPSPLIRPIPYGSSLPPRAYHRLNLPPENSIKRHGTRDDAAIFSSHAHFPRALPALSSSSYRRGVIERELKCIIHKIYSSPACAVHKAWEISRRCPSPRTTNIYGSIALIGKYSTSQAPSTPLSPP